MVNKGGGGSEREKERIFYIGLNHMVSEVKIRVN